MYIPRRAVHNFASGIESGDPVAIGVGAVVVVVGLFLAVGAPILIVYDGNKAEQIKADIDKQIVEDINGNTNSYLQSFATNKIVLENKNSNFVLRFKGVATVDRKTSNAACISYGLTKENFDVLADQLRFRKRSRDGIYENENVDSLHSTGLETMLRLIKESEIISIEINNIEMIENSEIAVEAGKPEVDEQRGEIGYKLSLTKIENNTLKMVNYWVSAGLDEELYNNPDLIYCKKKSEVKIEKIYEYNENGVDGVYKKDEYFATMPQL